MEQPRALFPNFDITDPSNYVAAWSTFWQDVHRDASHILQALDRDTGIVFDRVCQGGQPPGDPPLPGYSSDISYRIVSAPSIEAGQCTEALDITMPSVMLTVPTPMHPQSPIFVTQSPITVSKFFEALDPEAISTQLATAQPYTLSRPPSLAACGDCGLFEFEQGLQCRECDKRWLACKVWYRAQDGGRRRWLTAPYIRPGESNAQNRALMHEVGVPGCDAVDNDTALAICADSVPVRTRNQLRRVRRFLKSKAVRAKGLFQPKVSSVAWKDNVEHPAEVIVVYPGHQGRHILKRAAAALRLRLEYLWGNLAHAWRSSVRGAPGTTNGAPEPHNDDGSINTEHPFGG